MMEATLKCVITGARRLDFKDDSGKAVSMTQVYVEERFSQDNKDGVGSATVPYTYGDAKKFDEFAGVTFPRIAEVQISTVTTGSKKGLEVRSVKLMGAPDKAGVVSARL